MGQVELFAALGITMIVFSIMAILAVGAPITSVVSGVLGTVLPILLIYVLMQYSAPPQRRRERSSPLDSKTSAKR